MVLHILMSLAWCVHANDGRDVARLPAAIRGGSAADLVQQALQSERGSDFAGRQRNLQAALELDPGFAPAHWHLGHVRWGEQWLTAEQAAERVLKSAGNEYTRRRAGTPDTADGHLKLAQWCRVQGKLDEERAHLQVAAYLNPNDPRPARLLGFKLHNGRWLSDRERAETVARDAEAKRLAHATAKLLRPLVADLKSTDADRRQYAEQQILALKDPQVIPAIEEVISTAHESAAQVAVLALSNIPERQATWSIVRHGLWSPWVSVRNLAAQELRTRDQADYVPDLIALLTPTHWTPEQWVRLPDGTLASVLGASGLASDTVLITRYSRFAPEGELVVGQQARRSQQKFNQIAAETALRIDRAERLLRSTTGAELDSQQAWRTWWSESSYSYEQPVYGTRPRPTHYVETTVRKFSCFIAGTPVWTRQGTVAIDRIQLGDLVLAMHPETGELGYRPVVKRTVRPATQIASIRVNNEKVNATLGHPFWVAGRGWVRLKDLRENDAIRLSGNVSTIQSIDQADDAIAYNLEVAEFNTYFVGQSRILVHDNNPIVHSPRQVPGLESVRDAE